MLHFYATWLLSIVEAAACKKIDEENAQTFFGPMEAIKL